MPIPEAGKTTLAKSILKTHQDEPLHYNWDRRDIKTRYYKNIDFLKQDLLAREPKKYKHWVCFDEIHKMPKWNNILNAEFVELEDRMRLIVTGSARLDLFRRSGDSLAGRYSLFRLFPLTLREVLGEGQSPIPFRA